MHEHLFALEQELLTNSTRRSRNRLEQLLAPEFFEFGSSGNVWSRKDILERLPNEPATEVTASNFMAYGISADAVLVTYQTTCVEPDGSLVKALRSSIWKSNRSAWQNVFPSGNQIGEIMRLL
jgi:hypothetical protein